jgi:hypothetical protein
MKSIGIGVFKFSEAVLMCVIFSINDGGRSDDDKGSFISKERVSDSTLQKTVNATNGEFSRVVFLFVFVVGEGMTDSIA